MGFLAQLGQVVVVAHRHVDVQFVQLLYGGCFPEDALSLQEMRLGFEVGDNKDEDLWNIIV